MHRHRGVALVLTLALLPFALAGNAAGSAPSATRSVTIGGEGVSTYPAYDDGIDRFAVNTSPATDGVLTVTAGSSDPDAVVRVDGEPVANDSSTTVTALSPGDEVDVIISDVAGTTTQSFLYLPAGFPSLSTRSAGAGPSEGLVFLTLASYLSEVSYEAAVDEHGVPAYVRATDTSHDFKPSGAGDGRFTVARLVPGSSNRDAGYRIDRLGPRFGTGRSYKLRPVRALGIRRDDTDFHDVQLLPDGRVVLVGYHRDERRSGRTWLDAVIQVQDRAGRVRFTWSSKGHVRPREAYVLGERGQDYAHLNSVELRPGGDLVASFRNTGQVLRIATRRHDGHRRGEVIWRLGGERNEFRFVGDPLGGFCAQHDARVLPGGRLLLFDNGSQRREEGPLSPQTADMCPDPADPAGPRVARPQSRVVEYRLRPGRRTAELVWSHQVPGRYTAFAGSAERLDSGHTLVGWWHAEDLAASDGPTPLATEVDATGAEVWRVDAPGWFTYRARKG